MASLRKAVIPAAGRGMRSLPASKAIPKALLPIVDQPAIQYVVEEARAAGFSDVAIVTAPGKTAIAEHFAPDPDLEAALAAAGDADLLQAVRRASALGPLTEVLQDEPRGLGHAVACAEDFVGGESFAVLLADDILDERDPVLATMIAIHERTGASVVLLIEALPEQVRLYGSVDSVRVDAATLLGTGTASENTVPEDAEIYRVSRVIEKPLAGEEYSNLAVVGRYIFTPAVFEALRETEPGRAGEIQLTDAIDALARLSPAEGGGVYGLLFRGRRYDAGDKLDYLKAVVEIGGARPDLGPGFLAWLRTYVEKLGEG